MADEQIDDLKTPDDLPPVDTSVPYETYRKFLSQRKNDVEKMKELTSKIESYERKLKEANSGKDVDYKQLLETRTRELEDLGKQLQSKEALIKEKEEREIRYKKLSAFTDQLPAKLKKKEYYQFVDTDRMLIDPDTGDIDSKSLKVYAQQFADEFKDLLDFKSTGNLPNATRGGKPTLSYEEWLTLPSKEMKARSREVIMPS